MKNLIQVSIVLLAVISLSSCFSSQAEEISCKDCKTTSSEVQTHYYTTTVTKQTKGNTLVRYDSTVVFNMTGKVTHKTSVRM